MRSGKPCFKGTRITVYDVLEYLAGGMSEDEILKDFPDLTREDIRACLAFAARERRLVNIEGLLRREHERVDRFAESEESSVLNLSLGQNAV